MPSVGGASGGGGASSAGRSSGARSSGAGRSSAAGKSGKVGTQSGKAATKPGKSSKSPGAGGVGSASKSPSAPPSIKDSVQPADNRAAKLNEAAKKTADKKTAEQTARNDNAVDAAAQARKDATNAAKLNDAKEAITDIKTKGAPKGAARGTKILDGAAKAIEHGQKAIDAYNKGDYGTMAEQGFKSGVEALKTGKEVLDSPLGKGAKALGRFAGPVAAGAAALNDTYDAGQSIAKAIDNPTAETIGKAAWDSTKAALSWGSMVPFFGAAPAIGAGIMDAAEVAHSYMGGAAPSNLDLGVAP